MKLRREGEERKDSKNKVPQSGGRITSAAAPCNFASFEVGHKSFDNTEIYCRELDLKPGQNTPVTWIGLHNPANSSMQNRPAAGSGSLGLLLSLDHGQS